MTERIIKVDPAAVRVGTVEDGLCIDRVAELRKQSIPLLNDTLQKLVVLDTALTGVFLGLKETPIPAWGRVLAATALTVSLGFAFAGLYPRTRTVNADTVSAADTQVLARKSSCLYWAAVALVAGLTAGIVGLVAPLAHPAATVVIPHAE